MAINITNKFKLGLIFVAVSTQVISAEQDFINDIPVVPMNTSRMVSEVDEDATGVVSSAVDKAIIDAVAKSMPPAASRVLDGNQNVDPYGRPIVSVDPKAPVKNTLPLRKPKIDVPLQDAGGSTPLAEVVPQVAGTDPIKDQARKKHKAYQKITLKPGKSELIPVAAGLQNRIATRFENAEVKTSDMEVPISKEGGYIYITPLNQMPIGLMIGEKGMPETMVSVTLMPLDVPPVMIDLRVDMPPAMRKAHNKLVAENKLKKEQNSFINEAKKGPVAQNDPRMNTKHEDRASGLLTTVAKGEIPQGFDMLPSVPIDLRYPCDIRLMSMYHEVGQRLVSSREIIDIVLVKNDLNGFREIREEHCLTDDVVAVGVFDRATLAPGESAELYILRDKLHYERMKKIRTRPRLTSSL